MRKYSKLILSPEFYSFLHTACIGVIPKRLDPEIFDCVEADVKPNNIRKDYSPHQR
jgi:hypothetical protein